jgi:holo-[acyl-carrier protein] synthase
MSRIIGIGCDITSHEVTDRLNWNSDHKVLERIFSKKEIDLYKENDSITFLCGRFAAKEALLKSLGTGMEDGISLRDIEILKLSNGQPKIKVTGRVKEIADSLGINNWQISISHSDKSSMAFVLAEG